MCRECYVERLEDRYALAKERVEGAKKELSNLRKSLKYQRMKKELKRIVLDKIGEIENILEFKWTGGWLD